MAKPPLYFTLPLGRNATTTDFQPEGIFLFKIWNTFFTPRRIYHPEDKVFEILNARNKIEPTFRSRQEPFLAWEIFWRNAARINHKPQEPTGDRIN